MPDYVPYLCAIAVCISIVIRRFRKTKRIFITDYQRGLRFVRGTYRNELGPGSYLVTGTKEQIEVVDLRPKPVYIDRIYYQDAWQNDAMVTMCAEIMVSDAHLATTTLMNKVEDSLPTVRTTAHAILARSISEESQEFRKKIAADIAAAVNNDLAPTGMKIDSVEILAFWSRALSLSSNGVAQ